MKWLRKIGIPCCLFFGAVFLCWLFVMRLGVFGSSIDWISQHSVFPDYFRKLFYETGNPFPSLAAQIGGGQNIYQFSYYGLYNPVILISYLLPFVKMSDYMIVSSICSYGAAVIVFYCWIKRKWKNETLAVSTSVLFALSAPLLYHSYNQIMFVNYMPFLCLALLGVDHYLEKGKSALLTLSICGVILTSFYFSVGALCVLSFYGNAEYIRSQKEFRWKEYGKCITGFLAHIALTIAMCALLLVPTAATLANRGGDGEKVTASLLWFLPQIKLSRVLYHPYGMGLSVLALVVLISGLFYSGWKEKLLSIELLIFLTLPVFSYLLNGGLYDKDKVFIPCIPVLCYLVAIYLKKWKEINRRDLGIWEGMRLFLPYGIVLLLIIDKRHETGMKSYWKLALLETILISLCILLMWITEKMRWYVMMPLVSIAVLLVNGYGINEKYDHMISPAYYQKVTAKQNWIQGKNSQDKTLYRTEIFGNDEENQAYQNRIYDTSQYIATLYASTYNTGYERFCKDVFGLNLTFRNHMMQATTDNPVFQKFMGIKYQKNRYQVQNNQNSVKIDEQVLPIIYATDQIQSEEHYQTLAFPENQVSLLQAAVVSDEKGENNTVIDRKQTVFTKEPVSLPLQKEAGFAILPEEDGYHIQVKKAKKIFIAVPHKESDLYALTFQVENKKPQKDVAIKLEHQRNKLTAKENVYANHNEQFHFLVRKAAGNDRVSLTLGKGDYVLHDLKAYTSSQQNLNAGIQKSTALEVDKEETKGDKIVGNIKIKDKKNSDGAQKAHYLITSIPYDQNFTVCIDGKKVPTRKVNTTFLGCRITQGSHRIIIRYQAAGLKAGMAISLAAWIIFLLVAVPWTVVYKRCRDSKKKMLKE